MSYVPLSLQDQSSSVTLSDGRMRLGSSLSFSGLPAALTLTPTGVAAGTYDRVTVGTDGRVLAGSTVAAPTLTFSGDATGSGTTAITLTLANSGVTAGTYRSVSVNTKGQVTGGTNPTTLSQYGITDAQPLDGDLTALAGLATTGLAVRTATNTWATRSVAGTTNQIAVTNGTGVAGNITVALASDAVLPGTGGVVLPAGTTAQRAATPAAGTLRYNTTTAAGEIYQGGQWTSLDPLANMATMKIASLTAGNGSVSPPMIFLLDPTRDNKYLSAETSQFNWADTSLNSDDFVLFSAVTNVEAGFVMPYDGTITRIVAYLAQYTGRSKRMSLYLDTAEYPAVLDVGSAIGAYGTTLNLDFTSGQRLRMRARTLGGGSASIQSVTFTVWVNWRL